MHELSLAKCWCCLWGVEYLGFTRFTSRRNLICKIARIVRKIGIIQFGKLLRRFCLFDISL